MNSALKPVAVIVAVALVVGSVVFYSQWSGAHAKDLVPWLTDLQAAQAEAKKSGKQVLVYFTASWCGPCQQMKRTTFSDESVRAGLSTFIPVKIDVDEQKSLAQEFRVQSIPAFFVLPTEGPVMHQSSGYMDAAEFLRWLK